MKLARRQSGAAFLIAALVIVLAAVVASITAAGIAGSDVVDSAYEGDATVALYTAETAIERAIKQFATGTACTSVSATNATAVTGSGATYSLSGFSTDFSGVSLPSTQCRIQATGRITQSGVTRVLQSIVDKNLVSGSANSNFNNPAASGPPSGWAKPGGGAIDYAQTGGPDSSSGVCTRSAYAAKTQNGGGTATASGNLAVSSTIIQPNPSGTTVTVTVTFDYRINLVGSGCNGNGSSGPAVPCTTAGGKDGSVCFDLLGVHSVSGGATITSTTLQNDASTSVSGMACSPSNTPTTYGSCSTGYQSGYPTTKGSVTVSVPLTSGQSFQLNTITFHMYLKSGQRKEIWLDNIEISTGTATGIARVQQWRDCSVTNCPST